MRNLIVIIAFFGATHLFAQQQQDSILVKEISTIKNNVFLHRQEIDGLTKRLKNQEYVAGKQNQLIEELGHKNEGLNASLDSLRQDIETNSQNIVTNSAALGTEIQKVTSITNSQISELDNSLDKNKLYWIIATLSILLMGSLVYWLLGKRMRSNKNDVENQIRSSKTDVETQIKNTKIALEEESVNLDNKLMEVMETQLKLMQEEAKSKPHISTEKIDHSLALKVADEIIRIQKNLSRMDPKTRGLNQLNASVKRIQDNFAANGYELVEMLGKEYNEGLKATANFVQHENFEEGKRTITRIIKPQVNFNGEMIQTAQIEVTEG